MSEPPEFGAGTIVGDAAVGRDGERERHTPRGSRGATTALVVVATLGAVGALYAFRAFWIPLAIAVTLAAALDPVVQALKRARLSPPVGAALVIFVGLALLVVAGTLLERPARHWAADAPRMVAAARTKLDALRRPLQRLTGDSTAGATPPGAVPNASGAAGAAAPDGRPTTSPSAPPRPGAREGGDGGGLGAGLAKVVGSVLGTTASVIAGAAEVLLLLYFLLAGDERFLRRLVQKLPDTDRKRTAVEVVRESETRVGRYLGVTAIINVVQGVVIALALWWIGMPSPALWGVATFALEFLPYLGAAVMIASLAVVSLATFTAVGHALLAPAIYLVVTTLQNNAVSPVAYGRRLELNPFAVLLATIFWGTLWGVAGVFLAVPITAAARVLADRVPALSAVAALLGE